MTDDYAPTVCWTDHDGTAHRIRFEPTQSGDWVRIEEVRDSTAAPVGWRIRRSERIESVGFENIPREYMAEPAAPADD